MRSRTIVDEIESVMRERPWLPWYERYGPGFRSEMFRYPIEQRLPLENEAVWRKRFMERVEKEGKE